MTKPCLAFPVNMSDIIEYNVAVESFDETRNHVFGVIIKSCI